MGQFKYTLYRLNTMFMLGLRYAVTVTRVGSSSYESSGGDLDYPAEGVPLWAVILLRDRAAWISSLLYSGVLLAACDQQSGSVPLSCFTKHSVGTYVVRNVRSATIFPEVSK